MGGPYRRSRSRRQAVLSEADRAASFGGPPRLPHPVELGGEGDVMRKLQVLDEAGSLLAIEGDGEEFGVLGGLEAARAISSRSRAVGVENGCCDGPALDPSHRRPDAQR